MGASSNGSQWRRWDLHVHTPDSILESQYKKDWDGYIDFIEGKGGEVAVVGVTDYYSISGYKKILDYRHQGRLANIKEIFPNIELRITPETKRSKGINIHLIVDPRDENHVRHIEGALGRLIYSYDGQKYGCEEQQLVDLGRAIKGDLGREEALKEGVNQFKPSYDTFREWYLSEQWLKDNSVVVVANSSKDGASGIADNGLYATRKDIYRFTDMVFSGNPNDAEHFMGGGERSREDVVNDYGKIIPCIHGSDAHSLEKIFEPDLNRYCWIKADTNFDGFRQILYEPERVKIQELPPERKPGYQTIKRVRYVDSSGEDLFSDSWIPLNEDLNTIIGGKSSGKSMLLYHIAKSVNPAEVESSVLKAKASTYDDLKGIDFEVEWNNGEVVKISDGAGDVQEPKAITFIPQLYINQLADKDGKDDLNELISKVLMQNPGYKKFVEDAEEEIRNIRSVIAEKIDNRFALLGQHKKLKDEIAEIGSANAVQSEIDKIKASAEQLRRKSDFTSEDEREFNRLSRMKFYNEKARNKLSSFGLKLESVLEAVADNSDKWKQSIHNDIRLKSGFSERSTVFSDLRSTLDGYFSEAVESYQEKVRGKLSSIPDRIHAIEGKLGSINGLLQPLEAKVKDKSELDRLNKLLKSEEEKLKLINEKQKSINSVVESGKRCRSEIDENYRNMVGLYRALCGKVADYQIDEDIKIEADLSINHEKFENFVGCFNRTGNMKPFLGDLMGEEGYNLDPSSIESNVYSIASKIASEETPQLRKHASYQDAFKLLYGDYFDVDYIVTYKEDDIVHMSPGKRGLVLLSLMLELSNSTHPILIDQPEDNLDNRTIYSELKDFVKRCKGKRQIIMVTHNANLVVSADAECVIVADQKVQNSDSLIGGDYRFDYFGGSLELSYENTEGEKYERLSDMGIRQHVCHVLEGGVAAFRERERKYNLS